MLAIIADTPDEPVARVTPNLLPCRIHHSGPVGATESFWAPKETGNVFISFHLTLLVSAIPALTNRRQANRLLPRPQAARPGGSAADRLPRRRRRAPRVAARAGAPEQRLGCRRDCRRGRHGGRAGGAAAAPGHGRAGDSGRIRRPDRVGAPEHGGRGDGRVCAQHGGVGGAG